MTESFGVTDRVTTVRVTWVVEDEAGEEKGEDDMWMVERFGVANVVLGEPLRGVDAVYLVVVTMGVEVVEVEVEDVTTRRDEEDGSMSMWAIGFEVCCDTRE